MTRRLTHLVSGLLGTAITGAVLVGPPWLLTTFVGPPLPSSWPDLNTLRSIATVGVTDTFVATTLAVIIWLAWTQLALAIVIETVSAIRQRPATPLPLLPGAQPLAAKLVAAMLLLVTAVQPRPLSFAVPLDGAVAAAAPTAFGDAPHPVPRSTSPSTRATATHNSTRAIVVGERDSWWSLAETHLGDGLRWREIRELNTGRTVADGTTIRSDTDQLRPGTHLLVPAGDGLDDDPPVDATSPVTETDPDTAAAAAGQSWHVEPGDHFWHIAATTLEQTWGRTPSDAEIARYWRSLVEVNRDRLAPPGDPDLIHPGQQFQLPLPPADPTNRQPADLAPHQAPVEDAEPDVGPRPPHIAEPDPTAAGRPAVDHSAGQTADGWHRSLTAPPTGQDMPTAELHPAAEPAELDDHPRTGWGTPAGLTEGLAASMFLAAGAAALLHRRRRTALQQRLDHYRLPTLAAEARETAERITVAAPTDEALEDVVALLCSVPPTVDPVLVLAHDNGAVSLLFDQQPDLAPPAPWTADHRDNEPARWTARLGDRGERRSFGMPLLITLGRLDAAVLLINVGAVGHLAVDGPHDEVRMRLRAITLELATSRTAGPVEVAVVGDELFDDLDQVRVTDDPVEEVAAALREVNDRVIPDDRIPRLIVVHHGAPAIDVPAELAPFCGTVSAHQSTAGWRFEVAGERGWLHLPDGTREQVTLPDVDPAVAVQVFDSSDTDAASPEDQAEQVAPRIEPVPVTRPQGGRPTASQSAWCEVGLLGPFTVTKASDQLEGLTTISRQMLAYLVTHRQTCTGKLEEAVWQGQAARGGSQRVRSALGRLRSQLGDGPDGSPLLPPRKAGSDSIVLPDTIASDLDRATELVTEARQAPGQPDAELLLEALRLVRGEPFEDLPVSWAMDIQQRAIVQLQDAAVLAAQALRDGGRYDDAEEAIRQGLVLCDPAEALYVEWARLEHARGRTDQIPRLWRRLKQRYADDADEIAGIAATPTTDTELQFMSLM